MRSAVPVGFASSFASSALIAAVYFSAASTQPDQKEIPAVTAATSVRAASIITARTWSPCVGDDGSATGES